MGFARKSLDLHEAEGRAKKYQAPGPDRQEMLLVLGWLRHAQERGLNCWASASSFSCLRRLFTCLQISFPMSLGLQICIHRHLYARLHSQKNRSYQQIQSPNTFASPDLDPISSTTTRLVPAPAGSGLAGGDDHDKLTSGEHSGRGGGAGRDELGHQRRRFISWQCNVPQLLTGRTCLCRKAHQKI